MKALLHATGRLEASDSKTVRVHAFEVPEGLQALGLRFDYSPRKATDRERNAGLVDAALKKHNARRKVELDAAGLEDQRQKIGAYTLYKELNNLMNVVLIDPDGVWRGRWDRNPSSDAGDLVLSAGASSPGFLPGKIAAGRWQAAIECHGIFGEPVSYQLDVLEAAEPGRATASVSAPVSAAPRRSGPGWYFGELHSHTTHSDGRHELPELARRAAALGIDFLCLTDHNTTSGLLDPGPLPLTLVPGCELTTFHGHHPVYGFTDIVPWHVDGRVRPLEEMQADVRRRGGLVSVAHPFKVGDPYCTGCRMRDDLPPQAFDLIEVWYRAWDAVETDNLTAYALWNNYWQQGHRIIAVAARDWHGPGQEGPWPGPAPFTGVWAQDNTPAAIIAGLRAGRVIMSGGPVLDLQLEGRTLKLRGERFTEGVELRLFRCGERTETVAGSDGSPLTRTLTEPGWYRAEAWGADGKPRVITNHVVL
ncbi:MAG: CehA/McbA family metallohydrolase [Archangiaceae bacterium]|nr:CehA/McbA family metallohydrolase [Archangiaceae bacterium]